VRFNPSARVDSLKHGSSVVWPPGAGCERASQRHVDGRKAFAGAGGVPLIMRRGKSRLGLVMEGRCTEGWTKVAQYAAAATEWVGISLLTRPVPHCGGI